jgi:formylglycine-generating enzyme required for sulfatase activity
LNYGSVLGKPFALEGVIMEVRLAFLVLLVVVSSSAGAEEFDPDCDVNRDGVIDEKDIFRIQQQWHLAAPTPTPTPEAEITIDLPDLPVDATPLVLIHIPAGSFDMGSYDDSSWSWCYPCEQPVHTVNIGYDFYLGKYEITQGQWLAVMGSEPASGYGDGNDYPVYNVSWNDCQAFITALNALGQGTFRMPSEAEWEYACRAGTTTRFSFGDSTCNPNDSTPCDLSYYAWWGGNNSPNGTKVVGQKLPNAFGLYDMHGNVTEWCQDWWHGDYAGAPNDGSAWEAGGGTYRVFRGGDWLNTARFSRSSHRDRYYPTLTSSHLAFRVARDL